MKKNMISLLVVMGMLVGVIFPKCVEAESVNAAKIGDIEYATLEEAVNAADEGDTISILQDLDMTDRSLEVLVFPNNATLDLNGYTITTKNYTVIYTGIDLTIKNGTFSTDGSYALFIGDENDTDNVLVENINTIGGINVYNAINVVLKNVTSVGHNYYAVWADEHAQITIESGNYSTEGNYVLGISKEETSYIYVNGGNFTTTSDNLVLGNGYKAPVIYGGTFDTDPRAYVASGPKVKQDSTGLYTVGYEQNVSYLESSSVSSLEATDIILDSLNNSDIDVSNKNINIEVSNEKVEVTDKTKQNMLDTINKNYKGAVLGEFFDITIKIIDTDTNLAIANLTDLTKKLEFTIDIPTEMINQDNNIIRTYYIIREHDNTYEILDTKVSRDGKDLTFTSDKFSNYGIFYIDKEAEINNPQTSDNINTYIGMLFISILGVIILSFIYLKNNKKISNN